MYDRATVRLYFDRSLGVYLAPVGENERGVVFQEYPPGEGKPTRVLSNPPRLVGYVRDFIKIPTKIWGERDLWPWVFNVADMLLVGGVGILAIYFWRDRRDEPPVESAGEPAAQAPDASDSTGG
ncbi:MAG: signal peptidase II [Planctomycetota bacterium]|nr:MAG: signal peptidase II [Planctomycetota bacterium]